MNAADALRVMLEDLLQPAGWRVQFGRWNDDSKTDRYCVIKPVGGAPLSLVREPKFAVLLIGALEADAAVPFAAAEQIIQAMQASHGGLVNMLPTEPAASNTNDGRAIAELAVFTTINA